MGDEGVGDRAQNRNAVDVESRGLSYPQRPLPPCIFFPPVLFLPQLPVRSVPRLGCSSSRYHPRRRTPHILPRHWRSSAGTLLSYPLPPPTLPAQTSPIPPPSARAPFATSPLQGQTFVLVVLTPPPPLTAPVPQLTLPGSSDIPKMTLLHSGPRPREPSPSLATAL